MRLRTPITVLLPLALLTVAAGTLGFLASGDKLARSEMRRAEMQQDARASMRALTRPARSLLASTGVFPGGEQ